MKNNDDFNVGNEMKKLKRLREIKYLRRHGRSRLDKYTGQILCLQKAGATATLIQDFLKENKIKVVLSTVTRWLIKHG